MNKYTDWIEREKFKEKIERKRWEECSGAGEYRNGKADAYEDVLNIIDQLDEPEQPKITLQDVTDKLWELPSNNRKLWLARLNDEFQEGYIVPKQEEVDRAYRKGFKEGERQTAEYFESITEEPSREQVWKYLSEHGIEVVDKEPETVADVVTTFWKSFERLKEVMTMEVEELEE